MGVSPVYKNGNGQTFQVISTGAVTAGSVVEYVTEGGVTKIQAAGAGSVKVAGVATDDAVGTSAPGNDITYATGVTRRAYDTSTMVDTIAVSMEGVWNLTAGGAVAAFDLVKTGAAGTVVTWVTGTDNPSLIVGIAQAAIANGATGPVQLRLGV
jgi:hypothetical protein